MRWLTVAAISGLVAFACGDDDDPPHADADPRGPDAAATLDDGSPGPDRPPGAKRVFVTSAQSGGNLGGLAGADGRCQAAADSAGLGGAWVAWLSSPTTHAIDRLTANGPWYGTDGTRVFADKAAVADPFTDLEAGLWYDEAGNFLPSDRILTGTSSDGTYFDSIGENCQVWTSNAMTDQARIGQVGRRGPEWTAFAFTSCDQMGTRLICFEQ